MSVRRERKPKRGRRCRRWILPVVLVTASLMLSSCGKEKQEEVQTQAAPAPEIEYIGDTDRNTIRISSDGSVLEIAVEDYSKVEYDPNELKKYIRNEVERYNKEAGVNKISFREFKQEGDLVKTAISFRDLDTYNAFNRVDVQLSSYTAKEADRIAAEEKKETDTEETTEKPVLSDAELAEAGYDPADMEQQEIEKLVEDSSVKATFTGASGELVSSETIASREYMMLVTEEKLTIELENGKLLYVNGHAKLSDGKAETDGQGKAVIVLFLGM